MTEVNILSYVISPTVFEYDLESRKSVYINDLKYENTYKFYLPVKQGYTVEITLEENRIEYDPVYQYKMTIYEYLNKNSITELMKKIINLTYDTTRESNRFIYNVDNEATNYLLAELRPPGDKIRAYVKLYAIIPPDFVYNIYSDITYHYETLSNPYTYKFYLSAQNNQILDIELAYNEIFDIAPTQEITIYEYSSRYKKVDLHKFIEKFEYNSYLNTFLLSFDVGVYYSPFSVSYVALEIKPPCNMTSVNLTVNKNDAEGYIYDLTNNTQFYLRALIKRRTYKFYISAKGNQSVEYELTKLDSLTMNYLNIIVYEYSSRYSSKEISKNYVNLKYNSYNNSYNLLYIISNSSTTYVALQIDVSYDYFISVYLKAKVKHYNREFDLVKGFPKFIDNLYSKFTYKFYIPIKYHQKISVEFTGNLQTSYYTQYINIYEYSSRTMKTFLRNISQSLNYGWQSDGNYKYYLDKYTINDPSTTYIALEIKPNSNWESVIVNPIATSWATYEVELTSGKSKNLGLLTTFEITRFYIPARYNQTINIKFTKKNSEYSYTQMINIYEFPNRTSLDELRYKDIYLNYNSKKKTYISSYTVSDYLTTFVAFELKPDLNMKEVTVKATIEGEEDDEVSNEGKSYIALIIIPILVCICIIVVLIYFYIKKHRKNDNQLQTLTYQTSSQPLYPISQDNN